MSLHFYKNPSLDINRIVNSLVSFYTPDNFEIQHSVDQDRGFVQLKKSGALRAVTGFGKAITVRMHQIDGGLQAQVSMEDWAAKIAVESIALLLGGVGIIGLIGTADDIRIAHQVLNEVDRLVREQDPTITIDQHAPKF